MTPAELAKTEIQPDTSPMQATCGVSPSQGFRVAIVFYSLQCYICTCHLVISLVYTSEDQQLLSSLAPGLLNPLLSRVE